MSQILSPILAQWPSLVGLVALGWTIWKVVDKYTAENKVIMRQWKQLADNKESEVLRLRALLDQLEKDKFSLSEQYQAIREQYTTLSVENKSLKKLAIQMEEMVRATGGDVKVLTRTLEIANEELAEIRAVIALPPPKESVRVQVPDSSRKQRGS